VVLSTVALAANALLSSGDDGAKKEYLPGIASGDTMATVALTEPAGRWDEAGVTLEAKGSGDSWTLTGTKSFVIDGHTAGLILVAARTPAGVSLFAVPGDAAGLTRTPLATMDQTRKQAKLEFAGTPARLVGADGAGWATLSTYGSTLPITTTRPSNKARSRACSGGPVAGATSFSGT